jgi:hypothetical protein
VSVDRVTGRQDEEVMAFGASEEEAKRQVERILASNYDCGEAEIQQLLQQAKIEAIAPWCSSNE